jgi:uncharacterized protein (DUF169 family)
LRNLEAEMNEDIAGKSSDMDVHTTTQQDGISRRGLLTHTAAGAISAGALGLAATAEAATPAAPKEAARKKMDLSIFKKLNYERPPVGVKFLLTKPEGLRKLEEKVAFCEMLKVAQVSPPFYATVDNHECAAGAILLGMSPTNPVFESGYVGPKLGVYEDARANRRIYDNVSRLERGTVNYVAYSSLDKLNFDPDLLILMGTASQAEIVLRAAGYRTGFTWNAKGTLVLGCAWLYMYPYVKGEINMMVTGLHHGMRARQLFPEGQIMLSLPFNLLPSIVDNLSVMEWDLPQYHWGKEAHLKRMQDIAAEVKAEVDRK